MSKTLDDINWLTRSENRVQVLDLLAEETYSRPDLLEAIDVSRVTINRMIKALEERSWIEQASRDSEYRLTHAGRLVVEDLSRLLETTDTAERLSDLEQYLPVEEFDFDLRRLGDAEITTPTRTNTVAPLKESADIMCEADRGRVVSNHWDIVHVQAAAAHLQQHPDSIEFQFVFLGDSPEVVAADPDLAAGFQDTYELSSSEYYRHPSELLYSVSIYDQTVVLGLIDGSGFIPASFTSDDPEVLAWAEDTFERYKSEAESIDADMFAS